MEHSGRQMKTGRLWDVRDGSCALQGLPGRRGHIHTSPTVHVRGSQGACGVTQKGRLEKWNGVGSRARAKSLVHQVKEIVRCESNSQQLDGLTRGYLYSKGVSEASCGFRGGKVDPNWSTRWPRIQQIRCPGKSQGQLTVRDVQGHTNVREPRRLRLSQTRWHGDSQMPWTLDPPGWSTALLFGLEELTEI